MTTGGFRPWRALFVLGGVLLIAGGSQHPSGNMATMLADPKWLPGHSLQVAGFLAMCAGLALFRREPGVPARTRWWAGAASVMMGLDALEMMVHTLAYVDAGTAPVYASEVSASSPVLLTHLWMATFISPLAGVTMLALIWAGMRERSLGSPWIGWLGMIGAAAHAAVMPLLFVMGLLQFGVLFPMVAFMAMWFVLAGVWPRRKPRVQAGAPRTEPAPREAVGAV